MTNRATPADLMRAGTQTALLAWESQMVIAMRLMGMAGAWSVLPSEDRRMVAEKPPALAEAAMAAGRAAMSGKRPDQVGTAWARSLRGTTGPNMRRLARRGPAGR